MESAESPPPAEPQAGSSQKKVHSACQRCRQQKLKCDVYRPCTLCVRAGATCSATVRSAAWKKYRPDQSLKLVRNRDSPEDLPRAKRSCHAPSVEYVTSAPSASAKKGETVRGEPASSLRPTDSSWVSSSASMKFIEEVSHQHQTDSPDGSETSAFSASHWGQGDEVGTAVPDDEPMPDRTQRQKQPYDLEQNSAHKTASRREINSPAEVELLSLLHLLEAATMLVDNYFERVHWFLLVFHQSDFRHLFRQLYDVNTWLQSHDILL